MPKAVKRVGIQANLCGYPSPRIEEDKPVDSGTTPGVLALLKLNQ